MSKTQAEPEVLVRPDRYKAIEAAFEYDKHIRARGFIRSLSHKKELKTLRKALARIEGESVLDGPCGTGRIHEILQGTFNQIASMDSSEAMLHVHKHNTSSGMLCAGNIFHLPYRDNEFDWVVSYRLFHHMQKPDQRIDMVKSIARVGRHGVVFTAWIDTPFNKRRGSRRRSLTRKEIKDIVAAAGMDLIRIDYVSWPFQPKCVVTCKKLGQ